MARDVRVAILGDSRDFAKAVRDAQDNAGKLDKTLGGLKRAATGLAAGFAASEVVRFGSDVVNVASNTQESVSKMETVFGKAGRAARKFAEDADTIGLSDRAAAEALGTFGNLFDQLGVGNKQSLQMSQSMVQLAADLGSFHNADISEVITAQTAAFRGEYDALQRFIPTINAATVEQKALEMTGKKSTKELTAQEKALAVQAIMMDDAGKAAGDFARTSGNLANQQRVLSARWEDARAELGERLLPVVTKVTSWLASNLPTALNVVSGAFSAVGSVIGAVTGFLSDHKEIAIAVAGIIGGALVAAFISWASSAAAAAVATLAAIAPIVAIGAAIGLLVAGIIYAYQNWGWFRNTVDTVARFLTGTLWPALQRVASFVTGTLVPAVISLIGWFRDIGSTGAAIAGEVVSRFTAMVQFFAGLPGQVGAAASRMWEALKSGLAAVISWIRSQIDKLLGPLDEIAGKVGGIVGKVGGAVGKIGGLVGSIPGFDTGGIVPGPIGSPQLILAHGGETVLPTHKAGTTSSGTAIGGTQTIQLVVDGRVLAEVVRDQMSDINRRNGR